jgi:hypothetical protein
MGVTLAAEYGVTPTQISNIKLRRQWKYIDGEDRWG